MTYPANSTDRGILDGLNYVLSGPGSTGQDFAGYSAYTAGNLTGNYRIPFALVAAANTYVAPISLSNAEQIDNRTIKYTFTTPQASAPFANGNGLTILGVVPAGYNSLELKNANNSINQIGVIECTTTYVILRTVAAIITPLGAYVSGGTIGYTSMDALNSTDCDVRVTVQGGQERVFISAQLDQLISYDTTLLADMNVYVDITRYTAIKNYDPTNPDYIFTAPLTVSEKVYTYTDLVGPDTLPIIETVFAGVYDNPPPGYYRYIVEVYFETVTGAIQVTSDELRLRSLSVQVIKP